MVDLCVQGCALHVGRAKASRSAIRHLPPRTAVRERADRSQVTELLTNVRSGRCQIATHKRCSAPGDAGLLRTTVEIFRCLLAEPVRKTTSHKSPWLTSFMTACIRHSAHLETGAFYCGPAWLTLGAAAQPTTGARDMSNHEVSEGDAHLRSCTRSRRSRRALHSE